MNPDLQKFILETLQQSKDLVVTQAPDVIQQYLSSQYFEAWVYIIVGIILFVLALLSGLKLLKNPDCEFKTFCFLFVGMGGLISSFILLSCYATTPYKITHYPKAYLLESVRSERCR